MLYSFTEKTFYCPAVHGENVPDDVVEVTSELYNRLLAGRAEGRGIIQGNGGLPELGPISTPEVVITEESARAERDIALHATDWLVLRHHDQKEVALSTTLTEQQYSELQAYRQKLRVWPEQPGWPAIELPLVPEWLATVA